MPSTFPQLPLPASVVTELPFRSTRRMAWLPVSATTSTPSERTRRPLSQSNCAPLKVPLAYAATPSVPATVATVPSLVIERIT